MNQQTVRKYEGSHVYIFDSLENPQKIVLATNPFIGHIATPGFGPREEMSFEDAVKKYTKKQTGLIIDDLELLSEWDNDGNPFEEPNGIVQYVKVRNYLAREVPGNMNMIIDEHSNTSDGRKYKPFLALLSDLDRIKNIAPDVLKGVKKFNFPTTQ